MFELTFAFRQGSDAHFAALLAELCLGSPLDAGGVSVSRK